MKGFIAAVHLRACLVCLCAFQSRNPSVISIFVKVLGISSTANSESIQRAYKNKLREAKAAGNDERILEIENAHSSIMMAALSQRLKVSSKQPCMATAWVVGLLPVPVPFSPFSASLLLFGSSLTFDVTLSTCNLILGLHQNQHYTFAL